MPQIPRKGKSSKVGSNLKNATALRKQRTQALDARVAKRVNAQAAFWRERDRILTKPIVRKMTPLIRAIRSEYAEAALLAGGDGAKLRAAKRRAREATIAALQKGVPRFADLQRVQAAYDKTRDTIVKQDVADARRSTLPMTIGGLRPGGPLGQTVFGDYPLFDVDTHDVEQNLIFDESFVEPSSGTLVTNFHFDQNEDGFNRYHPARILEMRMSVGANFTVQQTGFIRCAAEVQTLFDKITVAISDNFGFSHVDANLQVGLFMTLVRTGIGTTVSRTVLQQQYTAHGDEFNFVLDPIPDKIPFVLTFEPTDAFLIGEKVQLIVGTSFTIDTDIDDMELFVSALLMWQVKRLQVTMKE